MKKTLLLILISFITIQVNAQQFTNKFLNDTLDMYTHWGIIRVIDTVYKDTTIFGINVNSQGTIDLIIADTAVGGETGIYSYVSHATNALTGELIGVRGNARVNVGSASGNVTGGKFQAGNMSAGYDLAGARGVYIDVVNKIPSAASVTWDVARGLEVSMDLDQGSAGHTNTVTDAQGLYICYNAPTAGSYSTITNGYGVFIRNEAVGGTGQMLDAGFYLDDRNHSPGVYGWDYGIDFSGIGSNSGKFGTADIKLANGALISNPDEDSLIITEKYTRFTDDVVIDSTLFEGIRYYAIRQEPGSGNQYQTITATAGSGNAFSSNIGQLNIDYHNLDSIKIDSIRWGATFSDDSIAIYQLNFLLIEETSTSLTDKIYINSGDSLFVPAGSSSYQYASKVFTEQDGSSVDVIDYPFLMGAYRWYWHNRTIASGVVRIYPPEIFLKAFYSK